MFNFNDIIQSAQGGQAVENIAARFGLSPEQAQQAISALMPAFSMGLQQKAQSGEGMADILGGIAQGQGEQAYDDPSTLEDESATQQGNDLLGQIFGSKDVSRQVAQNAASLSGVPASILKQMLPVLASMLMGGMFKSVSQQGLGGLFGQLSGMFGGGAAQQQAPQGGMGGLGDILGQMLGGARGQAGAAPGSLPGTLPGGLGDLIGQMMGGGARSDAQAPSGGDALSQMFDHGTRMQQHQQQALEDIFSRFGLGRKA